MFSIILFPIIDECNNMLHYRSELHDEMIDLERAISDLSGMSGMEAVIDRLKNKFSDMNDQGEALSQMNRVLDKLAMCYMSSENRICDYGEENTIHYQRRTVRNNDLSGLVAILNETF